MKIFALLACLVLVPLQSCYLTRAAVSEPLDFAVVRSIEPGATAEDVVGKMGAPDLVVQLGKRSAYRYSHTVDKGAGSFMMLLVLYNEDTRSDRVWFFFDENQILTHVGSTFRAHRAGFSMLPNSEIYDVQAAKEADQQRGLVK